MVVRDGPDSLWRIIGALQPDDVVIDDVPLADNTSARAETSEPKDTGAHIPSPPRGVSPPQSDHNSLQGKKRSPLNLSPADGPSVKRSRTAGTTSDSSQQVCSAPTPNPFAQSVFSQYEAETLGAGDIFLSGDWRKRWCRCDLCYPGLRKHPYLFEEEETYQPPEDPDSREF
jgi:E3 ubiquitin-protein ligase UBR7